MEVPVRGTVEVPVTGTVTFQSPYYPNWYPNNAYVVYRITGPVGSGIQFDKQIFSLEDHPWCIYDYLHFTEVVNGMDILLANGSFGGSNGPSQLRSTTNIVV